MNWGCGCPKAECTICAAAPQQKRLCTTSKPSETKTLLSADFGFGDLGLNQVDVGHLPKRSLREAEDVNIESFHADHQRAMIHCMLKCIDCVCGFIAPGNSDALKHFTASAIVEKGNHRFDKVVENAVDVVSRNPSNFVSSRAYMGLLCYLLSCTNMLKLMSQRNSGQQIVLGRERFNLVWKDFRWILQGNDVEKNTFQSEILIC